MSATFAAKFVSNPYGLELGFEDGGMYLLRDMALIGEGGYGTVYRVRVPDGAAAGTYALKCYPRVSGKETAKAEWLNHLCVGSAAGHAAAPYALGALSAGEDAQECYAYLMELVSGQVLDRALMRLAPEGALDTRMTAVVGSLLTEALRPLHACGLTHCDLSPANVSVVFDDENQVETVMLLDFGQSAALIDLLGSGGDPRLANRSFGAPEMFCRTDGGFGGVRSRHSADVWSVGGLLYWLRTGLYPHEEELAALGDVSAPTYWDQVAKVKAAGLLLPTELVCCQADAALSELICDCTTYDPTKRPHLMEVAARLSEIVEVQAAGASRTKTPRRETAAVDEADEVPEMSEAEASLRTRAEAGESEALYDLGLMLASRSDLEEAVRCFDEASRRGHVRAQHNLAVTYVRMGMSEKAKEAVVPVAEMGLADSQLLLAALLRDEDDPETADVWFRKAAEHGIASAQHAVGCRCLELGDMVGAERWLAVAAGQGDANAQTLLGAICRDRGDIEGALTWFEAAAKQGATSAQVSLACLLIDQNRLEEADVWLVAAMEKGDAEATYEHAVLIESTLEKGDYKELPYVVRTFRLAALRGSKEAAAWLMSRGFASEPPAHAGYLVVRYLTSGAGRVIRTALGTSTTRLSIDGEPKIKVSLASGTYAFELAEGTHVVRMSESGWNLIGSAISRVEQMVTLKPGEVQVIVRSG